MYRYLSMPRTTRKSDHYKPWHSHDSAPSMILLSGLWIARSKKKKYVSPEKCYKSNELNLRCCLCRSRVLPHPLSFPKGGGEAFLPFL